MAKCAAFHAIGSGVEYCCIFILLLLLAAIVGCMSYNLHIKSYESLLSLPYLLTTSRAAPTSPSSTSSWSNISLRPSLSTSIPTSDARLRKSTILLYGFSPLSRAESISDFTVSENLRCASDFVLPLISPNRSAIFCKDTDFFAVCSDFFSFSFMIFSVSFFIFCSLTTLSAVAKASIVFLSKLVTSNLLTSSPVDIPTFRPASTTSG